MDNRDYFAGIVLNHLLNSISFLDKGGFDSSSYKLIYDIADGMVKTSLQLPEKYSWIKKGVTVYFHTGSLKDDTLSLWIGKVSSIDIVCLCCYVRCFGKGGGYHKVDFDNLFKDMVSIDLYISKL